MVVDLNPSGVGYTEDFHRADSVPALLALLAEDRHLLLDALIITRARLATSYRAAQKPPPPTYCNLSSGLSLIPCTHTPRLSCSKLPLPPPRSSRTGAPSSSPLPPTSPRALPDAMVEQAKCSELEMEKEQSEGMLEMAGALKGMVALLLA